MPLLMAKLALVIILIVLIVMINLLVKKARSEDAAIKLKKMEKLGKMTLIIALAIVILAVCVFH